MRANPLRVVCSGLLIVISMLLLAACADRGSVNVVPAGSVAPAAADLVLTLQTFGVGRELDVLRTELDRFEAQNPGIRVQLDIVPADALSMLPDAVAAGAGPDVARLLDITPLRPWLVDLRPYLNDAAAMAAAFPPGALAQLRPPGDEDGFYGFPDGYAMTGVFVNRTLFDAAEVALPATDADWVTWTNLASTVAAATGTRYAIALDRSGHRFAGGALSLGAALIAADGRMVVDDAGVRAFAGQLAAWHEAQLTPTEVWLAGDRSNSCIDDFIRGNLVVCVSGSWQLSRVVDEVGEQFAWTVEPNPVGPGGSAAMASGATIVALTDDAPEATARLVEFLAAPPTYGALAAAAGRVSARLDGAFAAGEGPAAAALAAWSAEVPRLTEQALRFSAHPSADAFYTHAPDAFAAYFDGEASLDDALIELQNAIDAAAPQ